MSHHCHHQHYSFHHPGYEHHYGYPLSYWPEPMMQYYMPHCPACCQPYYSCCCASRSTIILPKEESVDPASSPKEVLIGGLSDVKLTLEYMPADSAVSPSVKVTITGPGGIVSTWEETSITDEYHVKEDFSSAAPGTKVKLEVTEAIARLRWCEIIAC